MARAKIDTSNKLTEADIAALTELHLKVNPSGALPDFGLPNHETWVLRDEATSRPVGFLHMETLVEIRAMVTDPDYEHKKLVLTIAHSAAETVFRRFGQTRYYITVPKEHQHVQQFYEGEPGCTRVDQKAIRYRKEL